MLEKEHHLGKKTEEKANVLRFNFTDFDQKIYDYKKTRRRKILDKPSAENARNNDPDEF
ncbi:hypothetical protein ACVBEF_14260 [Glaciimonas sp. GG7]